MSFKFDPGKQIQGVIISRKTKVNARPQLVFTKAQLHKVNKTIVLLRKLQSIRAHSLEHILIMVILSMIKPIMETSKKSRKHSM